MMERSRFQQCGSWALLLLLLAAVPACEKKADLDLKAYNHDGGYYPHNGSLVIPAGGLDGYYPGPTPPPGVVHRYAFTVKALNANGVVISQGRHTRRYPEND